VCHLRQCVCNPPSAARRPKEITEQRQRRSLHLSLNGEEVAETVEEECRALAHVLVLKT
jgi:hypothetical protein